MLAERTREGEEYEGVRVTLNATIAGARIPLQIDIGFGDILTPGALETIYPSLLEFPTPRLKAYPVETVVAEKLEAMVSLGMRNTRMKDFFDIWAIGNTFEFKGDLLATAIERNFARRHAAIPAESPIALTTACSSDSGKQEQWQAFIGRTSLSIAPQPFKEVMQFVVKFLLRPFSTPAAIQSSISTGPWAVRGPEKAPARRCASAGLAGHPEPQNVSALQALIPGANEQRYEAINGLPR